MSARDAIVRQADGVLGRVALLDLVAEHLTESGEEVRLQLGNQLVNFYADTRDPIASVVLVAEVERAPHPRYRARWELRRATWAGIPALARFLAFIGGLPAIYLSETVPVPSRDHGIVHKNKWHGD